jgi:hypothetical protein
VLVGVDIIVGEVQAHPLEMRRFGLDGNQPKRQVRVIVPNSASGPHRPASHSRTELNHGVGLSCGNHGLQKIDPLDITFVKRRIGTPHDRIPDGVRPRCSPVKLVSNLGSEETVNELSGEARAMIWLET